MLTKKQESAIFKALADDTRRQIVRGLANSPLPVHRIAATFELTRPAISRHLRILKEADLVGVAEDGRENVYFLKPSTLRDVEEWLNDTWSARLSALKTLIEEDEHGKR